MERRRVRGGKDGRNGREMEVRAKIRERWKEKDQWEGNMERKAARGGWRRGQWEGRGGAPVVLVQITIFRTIIERNIVRSLFKLFNILNYETESFYIEQGAMKLMKKMYLPIQDLSLCRLKNKCYLRLSVFSTLLPISFSSNQGSSRH